MATYAEYKRISDEKLIDTIIKAGDDPDGLAAKEVLQYRQYCQSKRLNIVMSILTGIAALSAVEPLIDLYHMIRQWFM